ncbi:hypothetical protein BBP40_010982 [Aspergillus hancockii]|nr:hypothetical protein BBP40_010982 [Aspergillus hancockii]
MSTNTDFLSLRNLLIKGTFCCDGSSFQQLYNALLSAQDLPASDDAICSKSGLTMTGYQALYTMVWPIAEKFQETQQSSASLRGRTQVGYRKVTDVCDQTLDVSTTVKADYDAIFNDLEKLFEDPDNETLHIADATAEIVRDSPQDITEHQKKLTELSKAFDDTSYVEGILRDRDQNEEDVQNDLGALSVIQKYQKDIIKGQDMENQSAASLSNLQVLTGAVGAISSDLRNLRQSIEENAHPGPGLLLGLEEKILELWDLLKNDVQAFKDEYTI